MRFLIGFRNGLFLFDPIAERAPAWVFPGIQPLSVATDPATPTRLYSATYDRGLWRSEDAGETWHPVGTPQDYFGPRSSGAIVEHQTNVCIGRPAGIGRPCGVGRHRTEPSLVSPLDLPSRATWAFPPRPDTHHVQRIAHGTDGRVHVAIEAGAMLLSRNSGRTFEDRRPGSPIDTHVLLTHPLAPGRLYAALGDAFFTAGHSFAESHDDGESWHYVGGGLEAMPYLYGLALNPADADDMLIAASPDPQAAHVSGGASIFRRDGDRWIEDADGFPREHSLVPVLAADPSQPGGWFALSDRGLFAKSRRDLSWRQLVAPELAQHASDHAHHFRPLKETTMSLDGKVLLVAGSKPRIAIVIGSTRP